MSDANIQADEAKLAADLVVKNAPPARDYAAMVQQWYVSNIVGSPVAADVPSLNYLNMKAIPALVALLKGP